MYLTDTQNKQILKHSQELEKRTGIEFMAAIVGKCDTYPEIPWKAFALGVALSALMVMARTIFLPQWSMSGFSFIHLAWVLGAGALAAVLTPFWTTFARFFLDSERAEAETRQYAQALFLERELFRTDQRKALLILIGVFEHQVVLLPDSGIAGHITIEDFTAVIDQMRPHLRQGDPFQALVQGIAHIEAMLVKAGFEGDSNAQNQIPNGVIQEKGNP